MKLMSIILMIFCLGLPLYSGGGREDFRYNSPPDHPRNAVESLEERTFKTGSSLILDLETSGSVWIRSSTEEKVSIKLYKYGTAIEKAEVVINEESGGIRIQTRCSEKNRSGRNGINMELTVPETCNLTVNTVGGDLSIDGVKGRIEGTTLGGDIVLTNLEGEVRMETLGGDIAIGTSRLEGSVNTLGGDIRIKGLNGNLQAETLGGKVVYLDSAPESTLEPITVDSLGGNINIDEAPAGIDAKTLGGNITIDRAGDYVNAETLGGDIRIGEIDGRIYASTLGGEINAVITGDPTESGKDATLESLGGDISLTVPDGLGMDIEIVLEISGHRLKDFHILSDFDLTIEEREATPAERENGVRRVITAQGITGDGGNRIYLSTINGHISLVRGD